MFQARIYKQNFKNVYFVFQSYANVDFLIVFIKLNKTLQQFNKQINISLMQLILLLYFFSKK